MNIRNIIFIYFVIQMIFSTSSFTRDSSYISHRDENLIRAYQINNQLETENLISKLSIENNLKIINTLSTSQTINYVFCLIKRKKKWYYRILDKISLLKGSKAQINGKLILNSNKSITLIIPKNYCLKKITLDSTAYINIQNNPKNKKIDLYISKKSPLIFPRPLPFFDFSLQFVNDPKIAQLKQYYNPDKFSSFSQKYKQKQNEFDTNLKFMLTKVYPEEGIHPKDVFKKWQDLDSKFNLNQLFFKEKSLEKNIPYRIPQLIHRIWITSMDTPQELPLNYIKWATESLKSNPLSEGWHHIFWIQNKNKIPHTVKKLEESGIEVREISNCDMSVVNREHLNQTIKENKFGKASDILRYIILQKYGGVYVDTDYLIVQSLNVFNKLYDFYVGLEPMSLTIGNAIIGTYPNHPIINQVLKLIDRNLSKNRIPDYIKNTSDKKYFTVYSTGPGILTVAFHQTAGQYIGKNQNRDIILQPMVLYPTRNNFHPNNDFLQLNEAIALPSLGIHFWDGTWLKKKFKSVG